MKEIYVMGSLNADLCVYASRFPKPGETLKGERFHIGNGGKGLNQAIAAARLGGKVHFLGAIGHDAFGYDMKQALVKEGIDVTKLQERNDVSSGVALITVAPAENQIVLDLGANLTLKATEIDGFLAQAKPGDVFLSQGENNFSALAYAVQKAHEKKLFVVLNPAPADPKMKTLLSAVDLLTPNETEAQLLSLQPHDVTECVITLGKEGFRYIGTNRSYQEAALTVKAIDSTGAGDAFCGSLCYFLARNIPMAHALTLASAYASLSVTKIGTSAAMGTLAEFKAFLTPFRLMESALI
jgi:ribokinase